MCLWFFVWIISTEFGPFASYPNDVCYKLSHTACCNMQSWLFLAYLHFQMKNNANDDKISWLCTQSHDHVWFWGIAEFARFFLFHFVRKFSFVLFRMFLYFGYAWTKHLISFHSIEHSKKETLQIHHQRSPRAIKQMFVCVWACRYVICTQHDVCGRWKLRRKASKCARFKFNIWS